MTRNNSYLRSSTEQDAYALEPGVLFLPAPLRARNLSEGNSSDCLKVTMLWGTVLAVMLSMTERETDVTNDTEY